MADRNKCYICDVWMTLHKHKVYEKDGLYRIAATIKCPICGYAKHYDFAIPDD